jgi:hypothetical protein
VIFEHLVQRSSSEEAAHRLLEADGPRASRGSETLRAYAAQRYRIIADYLQGLQQRQGVLEPAA